MGELAASPLPASTKADRIVVEKSKRTLTLFVGLKSLKQYPISLGRVPVGPKEKAGDKKTPEGVYHIVEHKSVSAFHRALRVSYPEAWDLERAKTSVVNPGSDIMIHGIKNSLGLIGRMHRLIDWTAGCIALTDSEIEQVFAAVDDGTVIELRP